MSVQLIQRVGILDSRMLTRLLEALRYRPAPTFVEEKRAAWGKWARTPGIVAGWRGEAVMRDTTPGNQAAFIGAGSGPATFRGVLAQGRRS